MENDKKRPLKYVIIGAGGTGGILGAHLAGAGKDVTLIARGKHLEAIRTHGLTVEHLWDQTSNQISVNACTMDEYIETPDVILVCVKGYSLADTVPFIRRVAGEHTVVIPVLNIYGTGEKLQEQLPEILVTDGCIYVSAYIREPGILAQHSDILKLIYGVRGGIYTEERVPVFEQIQLDFQESGIQGILSENVQKDCMKKFSYISPVGGASLFCNATAGDFEKEEEPRKMLVALMEEILLLADAMGIPIGREFIAKNLDILAHLPKDATTSMQRDVLAGRQSEIDGLIFEVVRMGHKYHVPVPAYEKVAEKYGFVK